MDISPYVKESPGADLKPGRLQAGSKVFEVPSGGAVVVGVEGDGTNIMNG